MDEATLRAIFDEKLKDVCKKKDLAQVHQKLYKHDGAQPTYRPPRTSIGGTATSARGHSRTSSGRGDWHPKLVLVRGSARWGAGPEQKIQKYDVAVVHDKIKSMCGPWLQSVLEGCQGYALNQNIAFKCTLGGDIGAVADALDKKLQAKNFKIREFRFRASAKNAPEQAKSLRDVLRHHGHVAPVARRGLRLRAMQPRPGRVRSSELGAVCSRSSMRTPPPSGTRRSSSRSLGG